MRDEADYARRPWRALPCCSCIDGYMYVLLTNSCQQQWGVTAS